MSNVPRGAQAVVSGVKGHLVQLVGQSEQDAAQRAERTQNSELTSLATDIVAGLRILRGIGGEATFGANYATQSQKVRFLGVRVGTWQGVVEAISVLVSGVLLVALVYLGTHELSAGRLTVGAPPIWGEGVTRFADPLPQALVLTAIVISFGMTALLVVLAIRARFESGAERSDVPAVTDRVEVER